MPKIAAKFVECVSAIILIISITHCSRSLSLAAALYFIEDKEFLCYVSMLLATALFGPVVKVTADGQVQLPKALASR